MLQAMALGGSKLLIRSRNLQDEAHTHSRSGHFLPATTVRCQETDWGKAAELAEPHMGTTFA